MVSAVLVLFLVLMTGVSISALEGSILEMFPEFKALVNSVEAMKKEKTAFMASLANPLTLLKDEILKFDNTRINIGNAYNKETGVFTATQSGLHYFSVSLLPYCGGNCIFHIYQNGAAKEGIYTQGNHNEQGNINVVLNLSIGDRVYVKSSYSTMLIHGNELSTNFSGFLI